MSNFSLNEVSAKAKLASKGAGYSWGMAEEVARSVYWLASRGLPAPQMLVSLLDAIAPNGSTFVYAPSSLSNEIRSSAEWLCPIAAGTLVSDSQVTLEEHNPLRFRAVRSPLLIVPFIAEMAAQSNVIVVLNASSGSLITDGVRLNFSSHEILVQQQLDLLSCDVTTETITWDGLTSTATTRVDIDKVTWERLDQYAHKTYAPATEASRMLGAGAGLNDND